jgi:hypothetical protein
MTHRILVAIEVSETKCPDRADAARRVSWVLKGSLPHFMKSRILDHEVTTIRVPEGIFLEGDTE